MRAYGLSLDDIVLLLAKAKSLDKRRHDGLMGSAEKCQICDTKKESLDGEECWVYESIQLSPKSTGDGYSLRHAADLNEMPYLSGHITCLVHPFTPA